MRGDGDDPGGHDPEKNGEMEAHTAHFHVVVHVQLVEMGIDRDLMQRYLDLTEELLTAERISGALICGTCMMDLDWESNRCLYEWLDRVGDRAIGGA